MSLLLDARKKSQQAQAARESGHTRQTPELNLAEHPHEAGSKPPDAKPAPAAHAPQPVYPSRSTGQNLFDAKAHAAESSYVPPNRNLLLALGGTVLLLGIGAVYLWHLDSAGNTKLLRPAITPPAAPMTQQQPATTTSTPRINLVSGIVAPTTTVSSADSVQKAPLATISPPAENTPPAMVRPLNDSPARKYNPIHIEQQKTEPVDPLLRDAYLAYRGGKPEEAQRLYLAMLKKDAQNPDALLGLATIARQRGEDQMAAQFYARALALDPRSALANAGMSALSADDDHNESHLKTLLREQGNSAALHFALGNLYAGQSRWGEAQQAYFNAYTLESGNAEFAFNLAVSLDHLGQAKLAAQHYQRALELDQSHTTGFDHTQVSQRVQELTH